MKKIVEKIAALSGILLPMILSGQTQNENYVVSKTYKVESSSQVTDNDLKKVTKAIQYFDGLGRAKQSVLVGWREKETMVITKFLMIGH